MLPERPPSRYAHLLRFSARQRAWFWPVLLMLTIHIASGRSQIAAPPIIGIDKLAHFAVFGLLATLFARVPSMPALVAFALTSLYGIGDEWHQSFTAGRSVEFADWCADTLGAACAVVLYTYCSPYRRLLETAPLAKKRASA